MMHLIESQDLPFETDLLSNNYSVTTWLSYATSKERRRNVLSQAFILERACLQLPRSYKLWRAYLDLRVVHVHSLNPARYSNEFMKVNALFERALAFLSKMPKLWEMYLEFLQKQCNISKFRGALNRALRTLPASQHRRIWRLCQSHAPSKSAVFRKENLARSRLLRIDDQQDYADLLAKIGSIEKAIAEYKTLLSQSSSPFVNQKGPFNLWMDLANIVCSTDVFSRQSRLVRKGAAIFRSAFRRYEDQRGKLGTLFATFYIQAHRYISVEDVFEQSLQQIQTVRDFTLVYDAYLEFLESSIETQMSSPEVSGHAPLANSGLELGLLRFEHLIDRRPFLLNDVLLRQNPNNVSEWEKRVALWSQNPRQIIETYTNAILQIDPKKAVGSLHRLWIRYARLYEDTNDPETAKLIFERATRVPFRSVAELADVWCAWAEMELRADNYSNAIILLKRALRYDPKRSIDYFDDSLIPQQRLHKSWKLWSFLIDLVESTGTLDQAKEIYEQVFELRIATPQTVVNFANLLEEHGYFDESFKIYERGLALFNYPPAFELWNFYLSKAMSRRLNIERLRDLFEQALESCPEKFSKLLYIMYAKLEEERGLARHAMRIYDRATREVSEDDRFELYKLFIAKSASNFGLASTRPIYERALAELPDDGVRKISLDFADLERKLGEVDRARAIYGHASQLCDPRTFGNFWQIWEDFEIKHGNEETFKEMLRLKRSVQAQYNTDVNFIATHAMSHVSKAAASPASSAQTNKTPFTGGMTDGHPPARFVSASGSSIEPKPSANPDILDVEIGD